MTKTLCISAAIAMALSGAAFAGGGKHHSKFGASASQYIDQNAQISASDCEMLNVQSARSACLRQAQSSGSSDTAVGATASPGELGVKGGTSIQTDTQAGSNNQPRR